MLHFLPKNCSLDGEDMKYTCLLALQTLHTSTSCEEDGNGNGKGQLNVHIVMISYYFTTLSSFEEWHWPKSFEILNNAFS